MAKKIIQFPTAETEYVKEKAKELVEITKVSDLGEKAIPFEHSLPQSIRSRNMWRNKYDGLVINVNPYGFESEEEYLACIEALADVMFDFDQA